MASGIMPPSIPYSGASDNPNGNVSFIIKNTNSQKEQQEHEQEQHDRR
jgi:hypothetical protein